MKEPREGPWALLYTAVSYSPEKGGEADGTRALGESPALPGVFDRGPVDHDLHIPKSMLAARSSPPSG